MADQLIKVCKSLIIDSKSHRFSLVVRMVPLGTYCLRKKRRVASSAYYPALK